MYSCSMHVMRVRTSARDSIESCTDIDSIGLRSSMTNVLCDGSNVELGNKPSCTMLLEKPLSTSPVTACSSLESKKLG